MIAARASFAYQKAPRATLLTLELRTLGSAIKDAATAAGIPPAEAFTAAYLVLLGKPKGPRLSDFIMSLDKDFAKKRLKLEA